MPQDTALPQLGQSSSEGPESSPRPWLGAIPTSESTPSPVRSLYIHVPFCFHKCHYCDFYSIVDTRDRQEPFVERLTAELSAQSHLSGGAPLRTIFVGGGTPSLLRPDLWTRLLGVLEARFDLSLIRRGVGEFTVECNPETVTRELADTLATGGVTRVSMGAQSFHAAHLKTLERWHHPDNVARAIEVAGGAGISRRSVDLIYAIPGQSIADLERDLDAAASLPVEHVSAYNLTYEPNTAMTHRLKRGEFTPADEDLEADMFTLVGERLGARGFSRYEVSNYARPGAECRHNLAYWRQEQWLACGPSASGHARGIRWKNAPRLDDYLSYSDEGWARASEVEPRDARRAVRERIMTGLRLREGLPIDWLRSRACEHGGDTESRVQRAIDRMDEQGLLRERDPAIVLSDAGVLIADALAARLMKMFL